MTTAMVRQQPVNAAAAKKDEPAVNVAAVVTLAALAERRHHLTYIAFSYEGAAPAGGNLKVEDVSGTTVFSVDITLEGHDFLEFFNPLRSAAPNTAMIVTLAAAGASVTGKLSIGSYTDK